jgi:hypothetical protein
MSLLNFGKDVQGYCAFAPLPSTNLYSATIASGTAESITLPSTHANWIVSFSYQPGSDIWVSTTTTAAAPAGGTFATTGSFLMPGSYSLPSGTVISFYNNGANSSDVGVALYVAPVGGY